MSPIARSVVINWTLIALAAVSLGFVVATREVPTSSELEVRKQHLLERFLEDDVLRVELSNGTTIVRGDDEARFRLTQPIEAVADDAAVDRLLRAARFATWLRRVAPEDVDDRAMGLAEPEFTTTFELRGARYEVRVGKPTPAPENSRYVSVSDGEERHTYVCSESTASALSPRAADFRLQRLLPEASSELTRVELERGERKVVLVKDQGFRFEGAFGGARLDPALVDRLFLQLARTEPGDFLDTKEALALQRASGELVTLRYFGSAAHPGGEITLGGKCPKRPERILALRTAPEPIAACVQSDLESAFIERPELLLDRKLFRLRPDEVEEIRVEAGGALLEYARSGDGFRMRAPESGDIERQVGLARLQLLIGARGEWLDPVAVTEPFTPRASARVMKAAVADRDRHVEVVQLGSLGSRDLVVRREGDGAFLAIDESSARAFSVDALMLRKRTLLSVPAEDIKRVEIGWDDQRQVVTQPSRGEYELEEPRGFEVDDGLASDLVETLRELSASEWISESKDESRFERSIVCTLTLASSEEPEVLELGDLAPGGVFATLGKGTFLLPRSVRERLLTWVVDRSVFTLDTDALEELELLSRGRRLLLERLGTGFVQRAGSSDPSAGQILELMDALSLLRAEGLVEAGKATSLHGADSPSLVVRATLRQGAERRTHRFIVGTSDAVGDVAAYYAWPADGHGVYALPRESVRRILELW
jgi:hypothetical protein